MRWVADSCIWTDLTPIPRQYPYLTQDTTTDVLIIGGGITGALTAYEMARAGMKTTLVEKRIIGYNSTRASSAILQYEIDTDLIGLKGLYGMEKAVRAFRLCEEAVAKIGRMVQILDDDCDFQFVPCLYYTESPGKAPHMREEYKLRHGAGFAVEWLDRATAAGRFAFPCAAGIYSTRGAGVIDPYRFTHALVRHAAQQGAAIYENTEVAHIEPGHRQVVVTTASGARIRAGKVVLATGYAAREQIRQRTAIFTRSFTLVTRPVPRVEGWHQRCIIRDDKAAYTYIRPVQGDRILIGGQDLDVGSDGSHVATLPDGDETARFQYGQLLDRLNTLFPSLALTEADVDYRFNGIFADTKDSLPYIGEYGLMPGCYFNLGFGANGILYDLIGARLLADLFLGKPVPDLALFSFHRQPAEPAPSNHPPAAPVRPQSAGSHPAHP